MNVNANLKAIKQSVWTGHYLTQMTFEDFAKLPSCTNQRNHEGRAPKAKHLHNPDEEHLIVRVAAFPNGQMFKLDGHTRTEVHKQGLATHLLGKMLTVIVFPVTSIEEMEYRMKVVDAPSSVKKSEDQIFGSMRSLDILDGLDSNWARSAKFGNALALALKHWAKHEGIKVPKDRREHVRLFETEIKIMDTWDIKSSRFNTGVLAAAFLATKKHGKKSERFWIDFNETFGISDGQKRDSVAFLREYLADQTRNKTTGGIGSNENHMRMALAYYVRAYLNPDKLFMRAAKGMTSEDFLSL